MDKGNSVVSMRGGGGRVNVEEGVKGINDNGKNTIKTIKTRAKICIKKTKHIIYDYKQK